VCSNDDPCPGHCGTINDGCGNPHDCGGCRGSDVCTNGRCIRQPICMPKCPKCGIPDGCGNQCGCADGLICRAGRCTQPGSPCQLKCQGSSDPRCLFCCEHPQGCIKPIQP
jgi:hypothetical protein